MLTAKDIERELGLLIPEYERRKNLGMFTPDEEREADQRLRALRLEYECLHAAEDDLWFIENFVYITTKEKGLILLKPNVVQERLYREIVHQRTIGKPVRIIILKPRQTGMSTITEALIYTDTATHPNVNSMIIAHDDDASKTIFDMSRLIHDNLPAHLQPATASSNKKELLFRNPSSKDPRPSLNSKILIDTAANLRAGRSYTIHNFHGSEVAEWKDGKRLMAAMMPAVPEMAGTMVILESTGGNIGDYFYDTYWAAKRGENGFKAFFFPWFDFPDYTQPFDSPDAKKAFLAGISKPEFSPESGKPSDSYELAMMKKYNLTPEQLNWRRMIIASIQCNGDSDIFAWQYPSTEEEAFLHSGRPVWDKKMLQKRQLACKEGAVGNLELADKQVKFVPMSGGYLEIWHNPDPQEEYFIGGDVAEGLEHGDYSCAQVLDSNLNHCAEWHGHMDPDEYGHELEKLSAYYNHALVGVEAMQHGLTVIRYLREKNTPQYKRTYVDKETDEMREELGWATDKKTRPILVDGLGRVLRTEELKTHSRRFIDECLTFIRDAKGKPRAVKGKCDDTIIAMGIAVQLTEMSPAPKVEPFVPGRAKQVKDTDKGWKHPSVEEEEEDEQLWAM